MRNLIAMYIAMQSRMQSLVKNEKGATMVEYALMVALIAVVCITAVTAVGGNASTRFGAIATAIGA